MVYCQYFAFHSTWAGLKFQFKWRFNIGIYFVVATDALDVIIDLCKNINDMMDGVADSTRIPCEVVRSSDAPPLKTLSLNTACMSDLSSYSSFTFPNTPLLSLAAPQLELKQLCLLSFFYILCSNIHGITGSLESHPESNVSLSCSVPGVFSFHSCSPLSFFHSCVIYEV